MLIYAIQGTMGIITTIAQIKVPKISKISTLARKLLLSPNCKGVKARLNIRLRINGIAIDQVSSFWTNINNTFPYELIIRMYKTAQTGPKSQPGGAH
jgi:hypothetical protein